MSINKSTLFKSHDIKQPPYIEEYNEKVHNGQMKKYTMAKRKSTKGQTTINKKYT